MPTFEIRYEKPPHAVGFQRVRCADEFDAQILGEQRYGDQLVSVHQIMQGDISYVEARDQVFMRVGRAPSWLRRVGNALGITLDPRQG